MCLLLHKPRGCKLDKEEIIKAWARNGDGAGFMTKRDDGVWRLNKGIMLKEQLLAYDIFSENVEVVLHLRWASPRTGKTPDLCHPFQFFPTDDKKDFNYLFHNGNFRMIVPDGKNSDTQMFADEFLSKLTTESGSKVLHNCSKFGYGKYITVNRTTGVKIYDEGSSKGVTENGIYFSNTLHRNYTQAQTCCYGHGSTD